MALLIEQLLLFVDFQILAIPPASLLVTTHWLHKAPLLLCALDFGALSLHRRFQTALSATFLVPRLVTAFAVVFLLSLLTFWSEQDNSLEQGSLEERGFNGLGLQAVGLEQPRLGGFRVQTGHQALICMGNRVYVVIRCARFECPRIFRSSQSFHSAVGRLENTDTICHGFPTDTEAAIYLEAAGEELPLLLP